MKILKSQIVILAIILSLLLIPCTGIVMAEEGLDVEKALEENAYALGIAAYIWGYPVVVNEHSRQMMTSVSEPDTIYLKAPTNVFANASQLLTPAFEAVQSANSDTIYSTTWLDLNEEPMLLVIPNTNGRYYTFQFIDAYTNNFFYASQKTRGFIEQKYAICSSGWNGKLPAGFERINAPTPTVFVIGRFLIDGPEDISNVSALQEKLTLVPLSKYKTDYNPLPAEIIPQKEYDGPLAFFEELGDLICKNNPPVEDAGLVGMFKEIGLSPEYGFDPSNLDEATKRGLERALVEGEKVLEAKAISLGTEVNGWQMPAVAPKYFGNLYYLRATMGWQSMYVNTPDEAYYPAVYVDNQGELLDASKNNYVIKFEAGNLPTVIAELS